MLHLKDKVDNEKNICKIDSVSNIKEIFDLVKDKKSFVKEVIQNKSYNELLNNKYIFSDGSVSDKVILKLIENSEINEYIIKSSEFIGTFINSEDLKIDKSSDYLFLYDNDMSAMIPILEIKDDEQKYYKVYILRRL